MRHENLIRRATAIFVTVAVHIYTAIERMVDDIVNSKVEKDVALLLIRPEGLLGRGQAAR